ncbi:MAG: bifunctional hydroxymethylpyrimidine kinase/phosphomethylpyrimidine kinase [Hyphomicrobiales bacterium]|nr:bifunctional hydroxymethylpyrimidine kinase/phosphomethylpyrimidine kinase [Hyphomicrobiales bacterium]
MAHPIALTIAGSDSSGGAGVQADLKTFSALGVYGASVITALTAQNTRGVLAVHPAPPEIILSQMEAVFADLDVRAVKVGMVGNDEAIDAVATGLNRWCRAPIVLDPVMVATSGASLLRPGAEMALLAKLLPIATIITPNLPEAAKLLRAAVAVDEAMMARQAELLIAFGSKAVLLKGGHAKGEEAADIYSDGDATYRFATPRIATSNTHGTGCTLSSAIAAYMALGRSLRDAVPAAKAFVTEAILNADQLDVGSGAGPVHHFFEFWSNPPP